MTDWLQDTPNMARPFCPTCQPEADPTAEILEVRYCETHLPARAGADDDQVNPEGGVSAGPEAGGEANRLWCQSIHRNRT